MSSSTAMLRAVDTDTRWSSDQASGSKPLTAYCSFTAGSRRVTRKRNAALGPGAASAAGSFPPASPPPSPSSSSGGAGPSAASPTRALSAELISPQVQRPDPGARQPRAAVPLPPPAPPPPPAPSALRSGFLPSGPERRRARKDPAVARRPSPARWPRRCLSGKRASSAGRTEKRPDSAAVAEGQGASRAAEPQAPAEASRATEALRERRRGGKRRKRWQDGTRPPVSQRRSKNFTSANARVFGGIARHGPSREGLPAQRPPRPVRSRTPRHPEGTRPQEPVGAAARGPRAPPTWARAEPGSPGPAAPARARASPRAMAAAGGLLLRAAESPAAAAPETLSGPRRAQARRVSSAPASEPSAPEARPAAPRERPPRRWQAEATKRKYRASSEAPPAKRRNAAAFLPAKKAAAEEAQRAFKGKAQKTFSPNESLVGVSGKDREQKPCVRTSSLFKNNPEIPELHRPVVKQVQEQVFTSDAFHKLDLHPHLISTINTVLNMTSMTSVQKQSIPVLLEGRDALVRSQTGSGKTLAYCIPVVQSLQAMKSKIQRSDGPYALVLVPTRELALQSFNTVQKLLKPFTWIVPGVLMGGERKKSEKARLRKGINILISTPGRLVDHIKSTKNIHFSRIRWLILDEADRILDLGFEKDITVILNAVNAECQQRQNVLLSATLTEGVTRLADISLLDPVRISVLDQHHGQSDLERGTLPEVSPLPADDELDSFAIPGSLDQHVTLVPSKLKLVSLAAFILQKCKLEKDQKMIIFFLSCELVEFYYHLFLRTLPACSGAPASRQPPSASTRFKFLRLHGNMEQEERTAVFEEFSHSKTGILLCTDVAARGLDLPQVTWIVQYNAPSSPAEYIHRIGRTARIGCRGSSLLILAPSEAEYVNSLASHKINVSEIHVEDILSVLTRDGCLKGSRRGTQVLKGVHRHHQLVADVEFQVQTPRHETRRLLLWPRRTLASACWPEKSRAAGPQEIRRRATVLQTVFEDYVHSSERRVSWAKKALQSFIRAYATYPRELKHIFHVRSLHLGHVAKSFGLRDAPQNLGVSAVKRRKGNLNRPDLHKKTRGKHRLAEILRSEYSSGIEASVAKVKKQNKHAAPGSQPCRAIRTGRPASAVGKQKQRSPCNGKTQRD
ncbi:probable ATP-dependent RNA helicase DDX31 isoform X3 [Felis catus]|uniref:probable ATP-dependent RNA helicase DDX31 isoform X3 n=1 Tax=Felis catus TaxID=9685 RepID=UPI001D19D63F|nr:probable ATP-dependent RNA helicase DDX31 isoform X3 [Felis catus]